MESLYILIPLSLIAVVVAVLIFFRMNTAGQFEDDQGPAMSILLDDDKPSAANDEQTEAGDRHLD